MKIIRVLTVVMLLLGLSGVANAFQITVLDPPTAPSPFFVIQPGVPFSFSFYTCAYIVGNTTYTGCAEGQNQSDQTITNLSLGFNNALNSAPITCSSNAFSDISCGLTGDQAEYSLNFADACGSATCGIPPGAFVTILENALPGSDFPVVDGVATAATPEPGSIWLVLSGLGSAGYVVRRRRITTA